ncbi:hypothetical protein OGAPHI_007237 [Ogataea philodendri]|uniref:BRO1 domain-containing protein n=1 Tax=Ogataea philodendri TaxID=1378263 RepID=A0A9P8NUS9_9ASCO|nr:uncharacterized protein OGAPHI_007237 [Ogataea philodendri]KAH3660032.1 hypothetical protein OGAPHI_007237 [Ogataea philodendri]
METNLLRVPVRRTDRVDLYTSLKRNIDDQFYQSSVKFEKNLREFDDLRRTAELPTPTLESIAQLKRYYVQLSEVQTKIPDDFCEFPWYGTLGVRVDGPFAYKSIWYERANILYQIAACYSELALNADERHKDDGIKQSCIYFQHSAGYFDLLRTQIIPQLKDTPLELRDEVLLSLKFLMLAQAQERFWLFAMKSDLKNTVVSKLSAQISDYYEESLRYATKTVCFRKDWIAYMKIKSTHFLSAAHYRYSLHCAEQERFGEEIAYLRKAASISNTKLPKIDNDLVLEDYESLKSTVNDRLRKAERENDLIYLQEVPTVDSVPQVSMVKSLIPGELSDPLIAIQSQEFGSPLFDGLVPFNVIQIATSYRDRVENYYLLNFEKPLEELNNKLDQFLAEHDICSQIEAILNPKRIPSWVKDNKEKLEQERYKVKLQNLETELKNARQDAHPKLHELLHEMNIARENDLQQRRLLGTRWQVPDFDESASECYELLGKLESYLEQSTKGDRIIFQQLKDLKPYLQVYNSEASLNEFIPETDIFKLNPDFKEVVFKLDDKIKQVKSLKSERHEFLDNLKAKMNQNQILLEVTEQYKRLASQHVTISEQSMQFILDENLRKFDKELEYLSSTARIQDSDVSLIADLYDIFKASKRELRIGKERETALKVLRETMLGYNEVVENLQQGINFYKEFSDNLTTAASKVSEFLTHRRVTVSNL